MRIHAPGQLTPALQAIISVGRGCAPKGSGLAEVGCYTLVHDCLLGLAANWFLLHRNWTPPSIGGPAEARSEIMNVPNRSWTIKGCINFYFSKNVKKITKLKKTVTEGKKQERVRGQIKGRSCSEGRDIRQGLAQMTLKVWPLKSDVAAMTDFPSGLHRRQQAPSQGCTHPMASGFTGRQKRCEEMESWKQQK